MNKMVVVVKSDQVEGFRLAGVDAIGVDDVLAVERLIQSWLANKEKILLALDDDLYVQLNESTLKKIHASNEMLLVTIPDRAISGGERARKEQIYDMIRHATGVQIRFKGEGYGKRI